MEQRDPLLIAGLGNPGRQYRDSRHNIGFALVSRLATRWELEFKRVQFNALVCDTKRHSRKILLAKPQTWMNESGRAIAALQRFYKVPHANLVVAFDDLDLPVGTIRIRPGGGSGGHRGMESIIRTLGADDFPRVRIGIGRPPGQMDPADYVLQAFSSQEEETIETALQRALDCIELLLDQGLQACMNACNPAE